MRAALPLLPSPKPPETQGSHGFHTQLWAGGKRAPQAQPGARKRLPPARRLIPQPHVWDMQEDLRALCSHSRNDVATTSPYTFVWPPGGRRMEHPSRGCMRTAGRGVGTFGVTFHRSELLLPAEGTVPPSWPCLPQLPKQAGAGRQAGADPAENDPSSRNKPGNRKPKQSERTAGGRGVPARSPPSPGAFFRAACAKSEATPSVTDRDVNPSAPEPCRSAGAHPLLPPKNPPFGCSGWLEQEDGRGSLLGACWQTSGAAGELQRWKEGRGEEGRSHCHRGGLGVAGVPEIPAARGGSPGKGEGEGEASQVDQRGCAVPGAVFLR